MNSIVSRIRYITPLSVASLCINYLGASVPSAISTLTRVTSRSVNTNPIDD